MTPAPLISLELTARVEFVLDALANGLIGPG
jgi:hypothetical protein